MRIYGCSSNPAKLREFALCGLEIEPLSNLKQIPAPEETGATFEENASAKALYYSRFTPEVVLADDSGIEVDALHGAPGVFSARYAGPEATDADNNNLLLQNLVGAGRRDGRFVCVLALAQRGEVLLVIRGVVEGKILDAPRGTGGFGYDPLFFYPPLGQSFAELTAREKFAVSHRGNALRCLLARLPDRVTFKTTGETEHMDTEITQLFLAHSVKKLRQMSGFIGSCLSRLTDDQIWSRGAPHENSIGNLILHLCGNVRQWISAGVGGEQDIRDRESEFSTRGGLTAADLLSHLDQTVDHAIAVINRVTAQRLLDVIDPQSGPVSVLEAIYQAVGHFQQHAGQIVFATKIYTGEDLGLYRPQPAAMQDIETEPEA